MGKRERVTHSALSLRLPSFVDRVVTVSIAFVLVIPVKREIECTYVNEGVPMRVCQGKGPNFKDLFFKQSHFPCIKKCYQVWGT